jgi:methionine-rich copper-binding protein CopC
VTELWLWTLTIGLNDCINQNERVNEVLMDAAFLQRGLFTVARGLVVATLMMGPFSSLILAHNRLVKTEPKAEAALKVAPARIQFWFEEKPDMTVTKVVVVGPSGVIATAVHPVAEKVLVADFKNSLAPGKYTVTWQTAGDDSHISRGTFNFTVGGQ